MSAALGQRRFPDLPGCAHCGAPIQTTNYSHGPKVEHYDPDASFRDSIWWHCRLTVATPRGWMGSQTLITVDDPSVERQSGTTAQSASDDVGPAADAPGPYPSSAIPSDGA